MTCTVERGRLCWLFEFCSDLLGNGLHTKSPLQLEEQSAMSRYQTLIRRHNHYLKAMKRSDGTRLEGDIRAAHLGYCSCVPGDQHVLQNTSQERDSEHTHCSRLS